MRSKSWLLVAICAMIALWIMTPACEVAQAGAAVVSAKTAATASDQPGEPRDTMSVSASISPAGMAVPAEAQVYLTLVNSATEPISDVQVLNGSGKELLEDVGTLSGSGRSSYVFNQTVTPSHKQLRNGGVSYLIRYTLAKDTEAEKQCELKVLAPIALLKAEPSVDFTRSLSTNYAQPGEEVSVTYRLRNTGNVTLTNITIEDALCGEVGKLEQLAPGKKESFTKSVVINETIDSTPSLRYSYLESKQKLTEALEPLTIYQADELLEVTLEADQSAVSPDDVVTLRLILTNKGKVTYDKLAISDQSMGQLGNVPVLKPGEKYVFVKRVNLKSTTTFLFSVNGTSAGGSPVSASSNMLTVAVMPVVENVQLELSAQPDLEELSAPGSVTFSLQIHNAGEMDIRNVLLSEQNSGEVKNLAVVPPGNTVVEQKYSVVEDGSFVFLAELSDAEGGRLVVRSAPIDITIKPNGQTVPPSSSPDVTAVLGITSENGYRIDEHSRTFDRMLIGVLAVLAVLLIIFLVNMINRINRKRKQRQRQLRKLRRSTKRAGMESTDRNRPLSEYDPGTGVYRISKGKPSEQN